MKKPLITMFLIALLFNPVIFGCNGYYWPMGRGHMYGYGMYGMGGGIFMVIIWIVILILLGFGIYYFIKNKGINITSNETPIEILKKRYAKGEISKEEYERMKEELK